MVTTTLNLQEHEQLEQVKDFWSRFGRLIIFAVILAALLGAGWAGWQYWQRQQAAAAANLYDAFTQTVEGGDPVRIEQAFGDMKQRYGRTTYAAQAGLVAAQALYDKKHIDQSRDALAWVADSAGDPALKALAALRLSSVLLEQKNYDRALSVLAAQMPEEFAPLQADRRGDVLVAQGKEAEARAAYETAFRGLGQGDSYRQWIAVKLNALGVDPASLGNRTEEKRS